MDTLKITCNACEFVMEETPDHQIVACEQCGRDDCLSDYQGDPNL